LVIVTVSMKNFQARVTDRATVDASGSDYRLRLRMRGEPQRAGGTGRVKPDFLPPSGFTAMTMKLPMMSPAQRHRELVADFAGERPILGKAQMMRIARLTSANQASLLGDEPHMLAIANASRFWVRQHRLVDRC
jgi:hypothetical protein